MSDQTTSTARKKVLDIPTAARFAGFSSRHFRKIIQEDRIPVTQIGTKMFIVEEDFETWKSSCGETRFQTALQCIDEWLREDEERARRLQREQDDAILNFRMASTGY
jgi:hypothetical protein